MAAPTASVDLLTLDADACSRDDGAPLAWAEAVGDLARVRGAFAVAWQDADGRVHLARDPIGHRSMYWGVRPDGTPVWGLRLHDVLRAGVPRALDPVGIAAFLSTAYVPGERTLVRGVRAVPAGVELVFERDGRVARRPFAALPASPPAFDDEETLRARLRATLEDAVERLLPDGPVAATLSGGIDSSLVVALARRARPVHAFSITFGPEHRDELEWSRLVARHTGATHEEILVRPADVMRLLDLTVGALSVPNGDPLTVPNTMLFEAARARGLDVVLNGEGGDPCWGGPKNAPLLLSELYGGHDAREDAYLRSHLKLWDELGAVLTPELRAALDEDALRALVRPWLEDARWPSFLDRLMAINVAWKGAGHILPKVEHLGLRAGVRPRSPLFDRDVVRLAFAVPPDLKRHGSTEKYLLKRAVADLLPEAIVDRPKSGMMVPVEAWFQGPLARFARDRLLGGLARRGLVERAWLERLLDARLGGLRPRRGVKIWLLLTLESWLRRVYDTAP